jgi:hypothetical protein
MLSSLQPDKMYFPFLGKFILRHVTFAIEILRIGANVFAFQMITSDPEHVPKIYEKSFKKQSAFIFFEWAVYTTSI